MIFRRLFRVLLPSLLCGVLLIPAAHAAVAVDGFYGGIMLGQTFMPNITANAPVAPSELNSILDTLSNDALLPGACTNKTGSCTGIQCLIDELNFRATTTNAAPNNTNNSYLNYDTLVFESGFNAGAFVGFKYYDFRVELEGIWNRVDHQRLALPGNSSQSVSINTGVAATSQSSSTTTTTSGGDTTTSTTVTDTTADTANSTNSNPGITISSREGIGGTTQIKAAMLNVYFDFDPRGDNADSSDLIPYIGFGVGKGNIRRNVKVCSPELRLLETDNRNAYQVILGTQYNADTLTTFAVDYRFFTTTNTSINSIFNKGKASTAPNTVLFGSEYVYHSINLTLIHHFLNDANLNL